MFELRIIIQLLALLLFSTTVYAQSTALFPVMGSQASSVYPWAQYPPGVTYNGGIPERPQCGPTLTPLGGGQSDVPQIQNAINNCPEGQHVQLGPGVFIVPGGSADASINVGPPNGPAVNNITIRGVGPGPGGAIPDYQTAIPNVSVCGATPCTILFKNGWQTSGTNGIFSINANGSSNGLLDAPINLASDAVQGSRTITLASAPSGSDWAPGRLALISILTGDSNNPPSYVYNNKPDFWFGGQFSGCAPDCFGWYSRNFRAAQQLVKIVSVTGKVVTIDSPLSMTFAVANQAQMTTYASTQLHGVGIEEMYFYGGGGGAGNVGVEMCDGCWVRHIESHWAAGAGVSLTGCYHCELRDSYIHENGQGNGITGLPVNGGGSYLLSLDRGTSNSLVENNILWVGDKPLVMRGTGGGNVIAYNYTDDQWDIGAPPSAEAGINAGHYGVSHFELMEGNSSHRYSGDSFWGNSIYITAFRNHLRGIRGGHGGLSGYVDSNGYPWCDCWSRSAVQMQAYSLYHSLVGNVLGYNGMSLLNGQLWSPPGFSLPVRVLSRLFRRLVPEKLAAAHRAGKTTFMATQDTWLYEYNSGTIKPN